MTMLMENDQVTGHCALCSQLEPGTRIRPGVYCWTTCCNRYEVPIVVLARHSGLPSGSEWRQMNTMARRQFPELRWRRPTTSTGHYYLHALDRKAPCYRDHSAHS